MREFFFFFFFPFFSPSFNSLLLPLALLPLRRSSRTPFSVAQGDLDAPSLSASRKGLEKRPLLRREQKEIDSTI